MSKLLKSEDLNNHTIEYTLLADDLTTLSGDIETVFESQAPRHLTIDMTELESSKLFLVGSTIGIEYLEKCSVYIPATRMNQNLFTKIKGISNIEAEENGFLLYFNKKKNPQLKKKFEVLKRNFSLKQKSYEMEIIETLVGESNFENHKYETLKSQYESLKARQHVGRDKDLEKRYVELMSKYKQSLQRLEKLRQSKLGGLQMAYWRRRGRQ